MGLSIGSENRKTECKSIEKGRDTEYYTKIRIERDGYLFTMEVGFTLKDMLKSLPTGELEEICGNTISSLLRAIEVN